MPIYFSEQAPTCPLSIDSSTGPRQAYLFNRPIFNRPAIPRVPSNASLNDVILIANIARSIVTSLSNNQVRNNVQPPKAGSLSAAKDKHKNKKARWTEQRDKRVRRKYKYFGKNEDGSKNTETWIIMERLERMVWYDSGWKSYLTWEYGEKSEGEPVR